MEPLVPTLHNEVIIQYSHLQKEIGNCVSGIFPSTVGDWLSSPNTQKMGNSLSRGREIKRIINPTEEMFQFMPLYYGLWTLHRWSQKALFITYQNISKSQDSRPFYGKYNLLLKPILPLRLSMLDLMKSQIPRPTTFFPRVVGNVSNHRVVLEWNIPKEIAGLNISQGHVTIQTVPLKGPMGPCCCNESPIMDTSPYRMTNLEHSQFWGSQYMVRSLLFVPTSPHSTTPFKFTFSYILAPEETLD